ncbi:MAG: hypothetical protein WA175_05425 [Candidatus Acidiferrales bacterium]
MPEIIAPPWLPPGVTGVYTGGIGVAKMGTPNNLRFSTNLPLRHFAQRLVAYEAVGGNAIEARVSAEGRPAVLFAVYEKLCEPLATLMGTAGLRVMVTRALREGKQEVPWLGALLINTDGFIESAEETAQLDNKEILEGEAIFVSKLFGLLITFIGATVTLHLVQGLWSGVSIKDIEF